MEEGGGGGDNRSHGQRRRRRRRRSRYKYHRRHQKVATAAARPDHPKAHLHRESLPDFFFDQVPFFSFSSFSSAPLACTHCQRQSRWESGGRGLSLSKSSSKTEQTGGRRGGEKEKRKRRRDWSNKRIVLRSSSSAAPSRAQKDRCAVKVNYTHARTEQQYLYVLVCLTSLPVPMELRAERGGERERPTAVAGVVFNRKGPRAIEGEGRRKEEEGYHHQHRRQ